MKEPTPLCPTHAKPGCPPSPSTETSSSAEFSHSDKPACCNYKTEVLWHHAKPLTALYLNISYLPPSPPNYFFLKENHRVTERIRKEKDMLRWRSSSDAILSASATRCAGLIETPHQTITTASTLANLKTGLNKGGDRLYGRGKDCSPWDRQAQCRDQPPALLTDSQFLCFNAAGLSQVPLPPKKEVSLPRH